MGRFLQFQGPAVGEVLAGPRVARRPRVAARTLPPAGEGRPCTGRCNVCLVACGRMKTQQRLGNRAQLRGRRRPWKRKVLPLSYLSRLSSLWMWKRTVRNNRRVEAAQRQAMPLFRGERLSVCASDSEDDWAAWHSENGVAILD